MKNEVSLSCIRDFFFFLQKVWTVSIVLAHVLHNNILLVLAHEAFVWFFAMIREYHDAMPGTFSHTESCLSISCSLITTKRRYKINVDFISTICLMAICLISKRLSVLKRRFYCILFINSTLGLKNGDPFIFHDDEQKVSYKWKFRTESRGNTHPLPSLSRPSFHVGYCWTV